MKSNLFLHGILENKVNKVNQILNLDCQIQSEIKSTNKKGLKDCISNDQISTAKDKRPLKSE
jgi:hypothetical protein